MTAKAAKSRQSARNTFPGSPCPAHHPHRRCRRSSRGPLRRPQHADERAGIRGGREAEDGDDAITQTIELEPDILLLDLLMPRLPGLEAMRAIMTKSPRVKNCPSHQHHLAAADHRALQIGARGIILKDSVAGDLTEALRAVLGGDYWIGGERVANLLKALQGLQAQAAAVPEHKTYGLTHANSRSSPASSRDAATATSPSSSPSARRP